MRWILLPGELYIEQWVGARVSEIPQSAVDYGKLSGNQARCKLFIVSLARACQ